MRFSSSSSPTNDNDDNNNRGMTTTATATATGTTTGSSEMKEECDCRECQRLQRVETTVDNNRELVQKVDSVVNENVLPRLQVLESRALQLGLTLQQQQTHISSLSTPSPYSSSSSSESTSSTSSTTTPSTTSHNTETQANDNHTSTPADLLHLQIEETIEAVENSLNNRQSNGVNPQIETMLYNLIFESDDSNNNNDNNSGTSNGVRI